MPLDTKLEKTKYVQTIRLIGQAFVDTVRDTHPEPCPEGPMYLAYMQAGGTIESFRSFIEALVQAGRLKRAGNHCLALGPKEMN